MFLESNSCKNRNDFAGQSIGMEWHVCLGDTSVQLLHKLKVFMLETGHEPESFPDRIIVASMFNDVTNWESPQVQTPCLSQAEEVANYACKIQMWSRIGKRLGNTTKTDQLTNMLTEDGTTSRFVW